MSAGGKNGTFGLKLFGGFSDAGSSGFYELTEMLRAISASGANDSLPLSLRIEYEKFVVLPALPVLRYECEIQAQINQSARPHIKKGYFKSVAVKWMSD